MVLVQKWPFFQLLFLSNFDQENVFYDILERQNAFLRYKNKESKKSKNQHFSKGVNPWFWSKNGNFFKFFFLRNLGQINVFNDILEKKTPFQAKKTRSRKSRKIDIFPKTLSHGFGPKMAIFKLFFLGNLDQENVFYDILQRKNAFLRYKKKKSKKPNKWHFSNGVNPWFWSKNGHFSNFFFLRNIGQENVFNNILEKKKAFLGYKNKKFKKSKN